MPSYFTWPLLVFGALLCLAPWLDRQSSRTRAVIVGLFNLLILRYHWWRITVTLPAFELRAVPLMMYAVYALELLAGYLTLRERQLLVGRTDRRADVERGLQSRSEWPMVDILVPTYNENASILRTTILAAKALDYPRFRVWVLDDSRRAWLAELCAELGVRYLTRSSNEHYKAGNLNNGLKRVLAEAPSCDFICVLDADFVIRPQFLRRTLALMQDPTVAVVQTPQRFYNPDPFQYAFKTQAEWPDDQRVWFEFRLPAFDAQGEATCCGTSFLLRAEALRELGKFPTDSICEDTLLSIQLRDRGWRTIYLDEGLSVGLSPEGLGEFLVQRARWTLGTTQILLYRWRRLRGLMLAKRVKLVESILRSLVHPTLRLIWPVAAALYWFTGISVVQATGPDLVEYAMPLWAWSSVVAWVSRGAALPIVSEAAQLVTTPINLVATLRGLRGSTNARFEVTPKGVNRDRVVVHWRSLLWMGGLASALCLGLAYRAANPWSTMTSGRFLLWNLFSSYRLLLVLAVAMVPCVELPKFRKVERFRANERARATRGGRQTTCELRDLSIRGALITGLAGTRVADALVVELDDGTRLDAVVRRVTADGSAGVEFQLESGNETRLISRVLCTDRYVPPPFQWSLSKCFAAILRKATT